MASIAQIKVDLAEAQALLNAGKPVLEVAYSQRVSPQRIYQLVNDGRLVRPARTAAASG